MRRREVAFGIGLTTLTFHNKSLAEEISSAVNKKFRRIGFISAATFRSSPAFVSFMGALRANGYIEGANLEVIDIITDGRSDRIALSAREIIKQSPDVIVASTTTHVSAIRQLNQSIPIVFWEVSDPVGSGFVDTVSKPGLNSTGVANDQRAATLKRVEMLINIVPHTRKLGYIWTKQNPIAISIKNDVEKFLASRAITGLSVEISNPDEFDEMFLRYADQGPIDAAIIFADPLALANRAKVASAAIKSKIPLMSTYREEVLEGALAAYGTTISDSTRLAGVYVAQILRGSPVSDLPVEYLSKYSLTINLRTANSLGINLPLPILAQTDEVIE